MNRLDVLMEKIAATRLTKVLREQYKKYDKDAIDKILNKVNPHGLSGDQDIFNRRYIVGKGIEGVPSAKGTSQVFNEPRLLYRLATGRGVKSGDALKGDALAAKIKKASHLDNLMEKIATHFF